MSGEPRAVLGPLRRAVFPSFDRGLPRDAADAALAERDPVHAAHEAGARDGRAAALAEWRDRLAALAHALGEAHGRLESRRAEIEREIERALPDVVFGLVRKILRRELATDDGVPAAVVHGLLERAPGWDAPVALRLGPRAAEAFDAWRRTSADAGVTVPSLRVEVDAALGPGEWMLETRDGYLDGRLAACLDEAWRAVVGDPA